MTNTLITRPVFSFSQLRSLFDPGKLSLFTLALMLTVNATIAAQQLTVKEIMKQPSIAGTRVSGQRLSPDGKWVVYLWNAEGKNARDLFLVSTRDGTTTKWISPRDLIKPVKEKKSDPLEYGVVVTDDFVKSRRNGIGNLRWSPDSSKILFTQKGDISVLKLGEQIPRRITKTKSAEFSADFLDNDRILFQQSGNIFSINTSDGTLTQITNEANQAKRVSVSNGIKSKDGSMMAYVVSDSSKSRPLYVPNYLPYYTAAPTVRRGWSKSKIHVTKTDGSLEKSQVIELPKQEGEAYISGIEWLADNKTLVIDRIDRTHKRRQMFVAEALMEKPVPTLIHEETDEKWIGRISRIIEAHPTNPNRFVITSEKDSGYNHLFIVDFKAGSGHTVKRLTNGTWEIGWAKWYDEMTVVFSSTRNNTAERTIGYIDLESETAATLADTFTGMRGGLQNENGRLIFQGSNWRSPGELFALPEKLCFKCRDIKIAKKLTKTTPPEFLKRVWNEPKFTEFKARDGKNVPAKVYLPAGYQKSKKHPMVVFVHGAGYLQNVINGWNNYYREFMFNQLLTRKGYVVLDIDYRGSAGYGRDWRTDVYDFLGGKDYEDHIDGIDFMVREYNIDKDRVGTYGGSYGGFMAAMLVMRSPDKIKAAAALRPVMDWKNYYAANPFYTSQRLGDPKKNPEAYKRSSPISYAANLENKLLMLHGILDDNVHVQDTIQLVEQLMRYDKTEYFELMLYPAERHGFQRPTSWEDEYERILALFEKELN
jgi:dipeptidyl aminopeptidase/acylaminoacyl peptidase